MHEFLAVWLSSGPPNRREAQPASASGRWTASTIPPYVFYTNAVTRTDCLCRLVPQNCSTPFWDPIKGECICTSSTCAFADDSRPIGVRFFNPLSKCHSDFCARSSLMALISLAAVRAHSKILHLLPQHMSPSTMPFHQYHLMFSPH